MQEAPATITEFAQRAEVGLLLNPLKSLVAPWSAMRFLSLPHTPDHSAFDMKQDEHWRLECPVPNFASTRVGRQEPVSMQNSRPMMDTACVTIE